ncbi:MAG TPA: EAL domain-containing protein [Gammaproteobacteria bacterium]|nr:EAL domain-containing protein [Gammaproteobacteria bacterium]
MAKNKKNRGKKGGNTLPGDRERHSTDSAVTREYEYLLHVTPDDALLLDQYQEAIAQGTAGFAEVYYNHLFDNPDIAEALYRHERKGGNVGKLVRTEMQNLLGTIKDASKADRGLTLVEIGQSHYKRGIRPAWILSAYHLLIGYIHRFLHEFDIAPRQRLRLEALLCKLLLRDLGLTLEGYWRAESRQAIASLQHASHELELAEDLLSCLPQLLWSVDIRANKVVYASKMLDVLYPGQAEAPLPCLYDTHEDDRQLLLSAWQDAISGRHCHADVRMSLAAAEQHWYRLSFHPLLGESGRPERMHCILEDINSLIAERRQLEQMATTDRLTGLPNRALWTDHLNLGLAASRRVPGSQVVVISLDINHFKMYNDTLGRDVGDSLLRQIAKRLKSIVRESDSLARLGGDHFGILLQPVSNVRIATERVITEVLDSFDLPFTCDDKQLCVSLTLGIACFPEDGTNHETLLSNAESAMHRAKRNGLPYQYFDPSNDVSPSKQLRYSGQIRSAIDNNEFELYYQPLVDIQTSRIIGAEALLRWEHPVEGTVMPQRIIPVAEQLGMITPITDWVLVTALRQCRQWSCNGIHLVVSVNVSARSFQNPRLLEKVRWALTEAGVEGEYLEIEITEATLMQDVQRATEVLSSLSDQGVTIAIDDFGTGYSSLSYLKQLPIHTLKIDQSFIMDVAFDNQDVAIVRSIIDLGHNLGYRVVAEGVETGMAWDMLNTLGCDTAQGFHISKPLSENCFSAWLKETDWAT